MQITCFIKEYILLFSIQIVIFQWTILYYYWLIYKYMWTKDYHEYLICWRIYWSHLKSGKRSLFHNILENRDILIKSLYEVYVWSLWRVDFVGILKHIILSQHQVLFGLFIDLDWLTFITFSMYVCMVIPYQHARLVGWRPN